MASMQPVVPDRAHSTVASPMKVRKRNGSLEPVDVNKIVRAVGRSGAGLSQVDPLRVATRTISGLCDGATTEELDELSIRTAASLIVEGNDKYFDWTFPSNTARASERIGARDTLAGLPATAARVAQRGARRGARAAAQRRDLGRGDDAIELVD